MPEKSEKLTKLILTELSTSLGSKLQNLTGQTDKWNRAPIHLAARLGNPAIISYLVEADVNLFQVDQNLNSALHLAASLGKTLSLTSWSTNFGESEPKYHSSNSV